jgi:hypothetical protein
MPDQDERLPQCSYSQCNNQLSKADVANGYVHCSEECWELDMNSSIASDDQDAEL